VLVILVAIIFVVLLLPVAVFLAAAVRFGGESRDRRLAALRLLGADGRMTRLVAAGEALVGALLGLAVGGLLFLAGRQLVPYVTLWDISLFAEDLRPSTGLIAAIAVVVPAVAVVVGLVALRGLVVEPLGVSRRATRVRRRLWWRLVPPALGLALLWPLADGILAVPARQQYQVAAGAACLLIGTVVLLPWLVERVVGRLGGGPVAWQLAVRRLQQDSATSARLINGIAVAVAGTIGLQMLFTGIVARDTRVTGEDPTRAQAVAEMWVAVDAAQVAPAVARILGADGVTGGVADVRTYVLSPVDTVPGAYAGTVEVHLGDCATVAEFVVLDRCADGDVFFVGTPEAATVPRAGQSLMVGSPQTRWRTPTGIREAPGRVDASGSVPAGLFVTPRALRAGGVDMADVASLFVSVYLRLDPAAPDAVELVRNAVALTDPAASVSKLSATAVSNRLRNIQRGLYIGIVVTLLLIAASMLVGLVEQLRERRRMLAMLVAVGTRRATLSWSVCWQTVVPLAVGLALATLFGLGLGVVLQRLTGVPVYVSWSVVGLSCGLAVVAVGGITAASLPVLWRLTKPGGLRTE
jgi:predicted lysophospholipase L1 biosynthesis ABC-type transport system permease subunit